MFGTDTKRTIWIQIMLIVCAVQSCLVNAAVWQVDRGPEQEFQNRNSGESIFLADDYELKRLLEQVPAEHSGQSLEIDLPMPDGSLARYKIFESSVMESGLAVKFPGIKSYQVQGIDHPGAVGRVDISVKGFRGMIDSPYGRIFIDPLADQISQYRSLKVGKSQHRGHFQCDTYDLARNQTAKRRELLKQSTTINRVSGSLLGYRLALSATQEYVNAVGGTLETAMSEINTAINRVNQILGRDLGIRLFLVTDNDKLIDVNDEANFTNSNGFLLLTENQAWIDDTIGNDNYDVGHILGTAGGGLALLQSVCGPNKAEGMTSLPNPTGDVFYINILAHEFGHQFGANHTFNGSESACLGNRNATTAFEPGSGSTIMSYAGICGAENMQANANASYHAGSIAEIAAFVSGSGASCATTLPITPQNTDPDSVSAGDDKTIPVGTAFALTGSANDADSGDVLSYQWDQMDAGAVATTATNFNSDQGNNPLFRNLLPQTNATRNFPILANQLNLSSDVGEVLPATSRTLNFRLTARDCRGGQGTDDIRITVDNASGPFEITSHSSGSTFPATSNPIVAWSVNGTDVGAVACANVDIDLLTFNADKSTYAVTSLASATANDGSEMVTIPDKGSSLARFRVRCSDNVFYDISDADLNITGTGTFDTDGNSTALSVAAACSAINVTGAPAGTVSTSGSSGGSGGGGAILWEWLFLILLAIGLKPRIQQIS